MRSSTARVARSPDFKEVREKLAEAREQRGIVRLADIIKERETSKGSAKKAGGNGAKPDAAKKADPKKSTKAEPEERDPQVEEAVEVLADLVALTHRTPGSEAVAVGGQ